MKRLSLALAVMALAAIMTPNAQAALTLAVYSGGTTTGSPIYQTGETSPGQILITNGSIGGLTVTTSLTRSNADVSLPGIPVDTTLGTAVMTSNSSQIVNDNAFGSTPIVQTIVITDPNYNPDGAVPLLFNVSAGGTLFNRFGSNAGNSIQSSWYYAPSNVVLANPLDVTSPGYVKIDGTNPGLPTDPNADTTAIQNLTLDKVGPFPNPTGTFRMTQVFTITLTAGTTIVSRGNNMTATVVPEPATMGAALVGLLGVALVLRRKSA